MAENQEIHAFAVKYHRLYVNPQTTEHEVEEDFIDQCFALGFEMDYGKKFRKAFSDDAFYKHDALDKIIDDVDDIVLLGSAIFSHWLYAEHGLDDSFLLDIGHRQWFIIAFGRLAVLTEESGTSPFIFEGTLQEIQLISNNIGYGTSPEPEDEVEQHLTIRADGQVWLSRYKFGATEMELNLIETLTFRISAEAVDRIVAAVAGYFGNEYDIDFVTDVGSWDLTLINTEGKTYKMTGPLCFDLQTESGGLSELIRTNLDRCDLFLFDGNPDSVNRIEIKYHRNTKIKPGIVPEGEMGEYLTWDYFESLTLDRVSETLKHVREIASGCKVTNIYYIQDGIASFLDSVSIGAFSRVEGNPPDVIDDPLETKEYTITLYTKHGNVREVNGTFDKLGLPVDWPEFIDDLYEFITFYGFGELFNERLYGRAKRRQSDYTFYNVSFEEGGRTYCYLADGDDYQEGDLVVVPAGIDNHEAVVKIESIEYHSAETAPFPVEKVKHILRRYEPDDEADETT